MVPPGRTSAASTAWLAEEQECGCTLAYTAPNACFARSTASRSTRSNCEAPGW